MYYYFFDTCPIWNPALYIHSQRQYWEEPKQIFGFSLHIFHYFKNSKWQLTFEKHDNQAANIQIFQDVTCLNLITYFAVEAQIKDSILCTDFLGRNIYLINSFFDPLLMNDECKSLEESQGEVKFQSRSL